MKTINMLFTIIVLLLFTINSAYAFKWKDKHLKGIYNCMGHGYDRRAKGPFIWAAIVDSNGKGVFTINEVVGFIDGSKTKESVTEEIYYVDESGTIMFGGIEGIMFMKGKGFYLDILSDGLVFNATCFREK